MSELTQDEINKFNDILNGETDPIPDWACDRCHGNGMTQYDAIIGVDCSVCNGEGFDRNDRVAMEALKKEWNG